MSNKIRKQKTLFAKKKHEMYNSLVKKSNFKKEHDHTYHLIVCLNFILFC